MDIIKIRRIIEMMKKIVENIVKIKISNKQAHNQANKMILNFNHYSVSIQIL